MTKVDCYYIRIKNGQIKTTKIHGVGIAYNVAKSMIYLKVLTIGGAIIGISPLALGLIVGVGQGFISAAFDYIRNLEFDEECEVV